MSLMKAIPFLLSVKLNSATVSATLVRLDIKLIGSGGN